MTATIIPFPRRPATRHSADADILRNAMVQAGRSEKEIAITLGLLPRMAPDLREFILASITPRGAA